MRICHKVDGSPGMVDDSSHAGLFEPDSDNTRTDFLEELFRSSLSKKALVPVISHQGDDFECHQPGFHQRQRINDSLSFVFVAALKYQDSFVAVCFKVYFTYHTTLVQLPDPLSLFM